MDIREARDFDARIWLALPRSDEPEATRLGAIKDTESQAWYVGKPTVGGLSRWAVDASHRFTGENRDFGSERSLYVDLVPSTTWTTNVRSALSGSMWSAVARTCRARAGMACELCKAVLDRTTVPWSEDHSKTFRLDCHERWSFNEQNGVQRLERLLTLCYECHAATHLGRSSSVGIGPQAIAHYARVRATTQAQTNQEIEQAFAVWRERSNQRWNIDLTFMNPTKNAPREAKSRRTTR